MWPRGGGEAPTGSRWRARGWGVSAEPGQAAPPGDAHRTIEHPGLEGSCKEHPVQLPAPHGTPRNQAVCLRALAKCFGVGQMPPGGAGPLGSQRDRGQAPVGFAVLVAAGGASSSSER